MNMPDWSTIHPKLSHYLRHADGLLICAGAGMGIDSGLPDFRGQAGFWRAYPALAHGRISFVQMANPTRFASHPSQAWGFYGHRLHSYRHTTPHQGFADLLAMSRHYAHGYFVFTSNVDGQFQKAGFDESRVVECHGSIHHLQCQTPCQPHLWPATDFVPQVDVDACELRNAPPRCPHCQQIARPNILMFGDGQWVSRRTQAQYQRLQDWLNRSKQPLVIELGAGTAVPSVREVAEQFSPWLIRINPDEAHVPHPNAISIAQGAAQVCRQLRQYTDQLHQSL